MPEVAESIADAKDSATPPSGFAQNDSIVVGVEISNGNKRGLNPELVE